ncbi:MAG TPA: DUF2141 domain-containing protein [Chakrabartia sp.]|nr:DUF2141 domain-containing protein [Chakrabartia sp.]
MLKFSIALASLAMTIALPATALADPGRPAALTVTVSGIKSTKGKLIACLWKDGAGFPTCQKSKTALRQMPAVTGAMMKISFTGLPAGRYALTVQHDENGDGKLQRNFIGMPTEGVGVSNNPGGMPGYQKSLVTIGTGTSIAVTMRYLFG